MCCVYQLMLTCVGIVVDVDVMCCVYQCEVDYKMVRAEELVSVGRSRKVLMMI